MGVKFSPEDSLLYRKIDEILWFDWDPIGVNNIAPKEEYRSYLPEIYRLKKSGANNKEIAKQLFKFETENMGMTGSFERCLSVADKIIQT